MPLPYPSHSIAQHSIPPYLKWPWPNINKYPMLARNGKDKEWSLFAECLSVRVRHLRHIARKKPGLVVINNKQGGKKASRMNTLVGES